MSCRIYSVGNDLIAGACVIGNRGLGVFGSQVPSTGTSGPGYLYSDLSLPADAGKEVRGLITRWPSGTFIANEDSSFSYAGATDYALYQLFVDGVASTVDIGDGAGIGRINFVNGAPINLVAADSAQANLSSAGAISLNSPPINLVAAGSAQANLCSTGAISFNLPPINLVAAGSTQANTCTVGMIGVFDPGEPMSAGQRTFGASRLTPKHLAPIDIAEVDVLGCDFSSALLPGESLVFASFHAQTRLGVDNNPEPLLSGTHQVQGSKVLQRAAGSLGVVGVTYLLRCVGTLSSGRVVTSAAFIRVVGQA